MPSGDISLFFNEFSRKLKSVRQSLHARPALTFSEKVLYTHASSKIPPGGFQRGKDYVGFHVDRVAMQDATAQMVLLQFMRSGLSFTAVPTTVHCDHLIVASQGVSKDLPVAKTENKEVYDFLLSSSQRYGIGFWKPGAGIIHQVVLENYATPAKMMIGTDSHTPNAGGIGMIAIGVGGSDAVDAMVGDEWELKFPRIIGVSLTGKLRDFVSPKDVILKLAGILTVRGGTGSIIEYFGPGLESLSCTGRATICNMGAELGATTSIFPYDHFVDDYLCATERSDLSDICKEYKDDLRADAAVLEDPEAHFDQVIELDLSTLEPHINGPFSPDRAVPLSQMAATAHENGWPLKIHSALIGSCTNSSYEDIDRSASLAKQAVAHGLKAKTSFFITPGSEMIFQTMKRDGQLEAFEKIGGVVLANACGPCIGQWKRSDTEMGEPNTIVTSFNRNFSRRNDNNPQTHAFVASPELVTAFALSGRIDFNPYTDTLIGGDGKPFLLSPPQGNTLPPDAFVSNTHDDGFVAAKKEGDPSINIIIREDSQRLQRLEPFDQWSGDDFSNLRLLIKAKGKCTTDHISMAGPWLRYRGHLDNISDNMLLGATNYFNGESNKVWDSLQDSYKSVKEVARSYRAEKVSWIIVGDHNYGEGSSREHAAMEPRHLGCVAVIVRSFARIHENNLKKQGVLALSFANPSDYRRINERDSFSIRGLKDFAPKQSLELKAQSPDGTTQSIPLLHTFNERQIEWFKKGSALNAIASSQKNKGRA